MNVLVGLFNTESNGNIPTICRLNNYDIAFGEECIDKIQVRNVFEKEGINIIPSIYANAGGAGVLKKMLLNILRVVLLIVSKRIFKI